MLTPGLGDRIDHRLTGVAIFGLALAFRLVHLLDIYSLPHFSVLVLDAQEYDAMASRLLGGDWLLDLEQGYVHGILFPILLAALKWLGFGPVGTRVVQALMGALCCWLIHRITRRCATPEAAMIAGVLAAAYWPFIVFGGELLATTLVLLLQLALADLLLAVPRAPGVSPRQAVLAGVLLGLLIMTRANAALLLPLVVWWVWRSRGGRRWRPCIELVVAMLMILSPYLVRNQILQGSPMPFQGGWSFYQGANPDADGTPYVRLGAEWQRLESLAIRAGATEPAARGAYYLERSLQFIGDSPEKWAALSYRKLRLFWHEHEVPVSADLRTYEARSRLWWVLPSGLGLVLPLALAGFLLGGGLKQPDRRLLAGFVLVWLVSGLLFTVSARYRLPAAPFLIMFAGLGVAALARVIRRREVKGCLVGTGAVVAGLLVAYTGVDTEAVDHLRSEWLLAHMQIRQGDYRAAEESLHAALARDPGSANVHNSLGVVSEYLGRPQEAERAYREALKLEPGYARGWLNLGKLLLRGGRVAAGSGAIRQALDLDPRGPVQYAGWFQLGQAGLSQRRYEQARQAFTRALEARETAAAWYGKSVASGGLGMRDQLRCLEHAVELEPGLAPAQRNLGALYLQAGRYDVAEKALLAAVAADPTEGLTYQHLANLYGATGRPEAAGKTEAEAARRSR
ncbi:MAG: tetratricopeptide repeat protein [Candidatus Latescibacterota bacterium]